MKIQFIAFIFVCIITASCSSRTGSSGAADTDKAGGTSFELSDPQATPMARALYRNLQLLAGEHVLLGHQDALAYGMGWKGGAFHTDIHDVCGDHPAVFGWDLGHMGDTVNIDGVPFEEMRKWAISVFEHGGINTYSWHMRNYAVGGTSWDIDSCVEACLPGGRIHGTYLEKLDLAAEFFSSLTTETGELIPVIFRPFHEMTGGWFWWGTRSCSPEQYKELFRFTIDYLRNEKQLHQLIIAYSPDAFSSAEQYMTFYPGDGYVDVMGIDDYRGFSNRKETPGAIKRLEILDSLSTAHSKLMTIAETGLETIPNEVWFTDVVLSTLKHNTSTQKASWILFWRNGRPDHFYAPYPGHPSAPDFIQFMNDSLMFSLSELPDLYK
jgi:mannan endo-1,4-beta-mannosidase